MASLSVRVCKRPPAVDNDDEIVIHYVCKESGKVFELPLAGECCEHPETGRQTLVPTIYDLVEKSGGQGHRLEMRQMGYFHQSTRDKTFLWKTVLIFVSKVNTA